MNLGQLTTYVRQRLGIEHNETIADDELLVMINLSLAAGDEILVTEYEDYHLTTYLSTIGVPSPGGAQSNRIPLPPDFFKLRGLDFGSPGMWITIYGFGFQQRNYFNSPYSNMYANYGNQVQRKVRVEDRWLLVEPMNLCSGQYQVWYTPKFTWLVNPVDLLPTDMDSESWVEFVVACTGEKVYAKLNLPTQSMVEQKMYYEDKIRNSGKNRMSLGPMSVINVRNRGGGYRGGRRGFGG
jgi:hypothetical protein